MPRGSTTQTRTFNYMQGPTLTGYLQSATNPENGTVSYMYNSNGQVTKTDAKNQQIQYSYDSYGRLTQVRHYPVAGQAEDTSQQVNYYYDTNPFDSQGFSKNILGRLAAVTYSPVALKTQNPPPLPLFAEWYSYVQAGGVSAKRLQVQQPLLPGQGAAPILNCDANYTFDSQGEGKIASVQYPTTYPSGNTVAGPTYTYTFDSMGRPSTLTDQNNNTIVNGVNYSAANQLTAIGYPFLAYTENRTYNSLLQLTGITFQSGSQYSVILTYAYPTGANNGKISSMTDAVTGETVQYTYDSLNRLILAQTSTATTPWGQGFSYDAFGNLTGKSVTLGSAPTMSLQVNPATNRPTGMTDANGNWTGILPSTPNYAYDVENRMQQANPSGGGTVYFAYDTQNRRVWQWNGGLNQYGGAGPYTIYFYGINGQRLASYTVNVAYVQPGLTLQSQVVVQDKYFGAKRIAPTDQVGSARGYGTNSAGYYPFGEDKGTPGANDIWKFGTYWRDSATGLDYALSRYYSSTLGRFMTPDQRQASGEAQSPQSWNRYGYVTGDPINLYDPKGQFETAPGDDSSCWSDDYGNMVCPGQGGTPYCADSGYYYNPGTGNCDAVPSEPQAAESHTAPQCDIKLFDANIPVASKGIPAVHSYLDVEDPSGNWHVLEGIQSSMKKSFIPGWSFLTASDTQTGALEIDDPTNNRLDYDSANSRSLSSTLVCADVAALIGAERNFPNKRLRYDLSGILFPNSNSFIRYLLTFTTGLSITAPPGAIGWNHTVLGR